MSHLAKRKSNKANLSILYPWRRVILVKLINHKTQIPFLQPLSSLWISYRSKSKAYQLVFVLSSMRNKLICTISVSDSNLTKRSMVCVSSMCLLLCYSIILSPYFDMQHDHIQIFLLFILYSVFAFYSDFFTFQSNPQVEDVCMDRMCACMVLYALFPLI